MNDPQLQDSDTPANIQMLLTWTFTCYNDIKNWMKDNKLLNDDKTEAFLIGTRQKLSQFLLPLSSATILISDCQEAESHFQQQSVHHFVSKSAKSC